MAYYSIVRGGWVSCFVSACAAIRFLSLWFHFAVVTAPMFSETTGHSGSPLDEWQRVVLLETRGLWLYSIVRGGIG